MEISSKFWGFCFVSVRARWHEDLSSLTRDRTHMPPALGAQSLNHWATREVPSTFLDMQKMWIYNCGEMPRHCGKKRQIPQQCLLFKPEFPVPNMCQELSCF